MSHLKEYKTNLQNLIFLKSALNRMKISYHVSGQNIILPQTKDKNASFCWDGTNYTLIYDIDFWTNPLTVNSFTEKVTREYSAEKVVQDMKKFGFQSESYKNSSKSDEYQTIKSKDLVFSRHRF